MDIEEKAEALINEFKAKISGAVEEVLSDAYCDVLPHVEQDTVFNVNSCTESVVKSLLAKRYRIDGDVFIVEDANGIDVSIKITADQFDNIRQSLIEAMPISPKDLEIASLKSQLKRAYEIRSY